MPWQLVRGYSEAYFAKPIDAADVQTLVGQTDIVKYQSLRHKCDGRNHYSMKVLISSSQ